MKVAVGGSRKRQDRRFIFNKLDLFIREGDVMISGGASGVDSIACEYAKRRKLKMEIFAPDYRKHGKNARKMRNKKIINNADVLLAFPLKSKEDGTWHAISIAHKAKKRIMIWER